MTIFVDFHAVLFLQYQLAMLGLIKLIELINLQIAGADPYSGKEGQAILSGILLRLGIRKDGGVVGHAHYAHGAFDVAAATDISRWGESTSWGQRSLV